MLARFKLLFSIIRKTLPGVPVAYVSIKPSPSRWNIHGRMEEANKAIEAFLKTQRATSFIDVYHKMLDKDGEPIKDIFLEDKLHMNAKGYAIWKKVIQPYLLK